ncbi:MAG: oligopeptide transport system substrate-binding protein [Verrucomicrobia bacterium]|nr:MAG: oligopeptide transport system substrate-binding protein [Verrucomicrobiota bacterium]
MATLADRFVWGRPEGHRLGLALILLLSGCDRRESAVTSGNRDQVLHRGIGSEVSDLDPQLAANIAEGDIASALFEGLVVEDPVDLHPVPGVAESWETSPDQLTYLFHLRSTARWSNGAPVTAQDFVASWKRILTPTLGASNADLLHLIQGAEAFHKGLTQDFGSVGVTAVDDRTLRVRLEHPAPYFLSLLTNPVWSPVPVALLAASGPAAERGNRWARAGSLVGNGPFNLKSWEPNQRIIVEKSLTYWDAARVRLTAINFYPIESGDAEERAFRTGQLHVTYVLPFGKVEAYRRDAPQFLRADPYLNTYFFRLNLRRPPFGDERVRRALSQAVDRTAIVEKILHGGQLAATAITPPGLPGYVPPAGRPTDFAAARRLLAEAGFPGGKGLPPIELLYNTSDNHRTLAEAVQEMWRRELGLEVRLVSQEFKGVLNERRTGNYQILLSDWVGDYADPGTFLDLWRSDSGNNHTGWSSPAFDNLLFAAARTADAAERMNQLQQAESLLLAATPIIPLYYNTHVFLVQPSVKGWHPTLLDHHPYKHVWLEE